MAERDGSSAGRLTGQMAEREAVDPRGWTDGGGCARVAAMPERVGDV